MAGTDKNDFLNLLGNTTNVPPSPTPPAVSITDARLSEPAGTAMGRAEMLFMVRLSHASSVPIAVQYQTGGGDATGWQLYFTDENGFPKLDTAGNKIVNSGGTNRTEGLLADYVADKGILTFAPFETTKVIPVTLLTSAIADLPEERFNVTLSSPTNATLGRAQATGTIVCSGMADNLPEDQSPAGDMFSVGRTDAPQAAAPTIYQGPVAYLQYQYLGTTAGEAVSSTAKNDFVFLLGGDDACDGKEGDDVIDGGLGSSFLTGGAGRDVFFLDGRNGDVTWGTITDWQTGEELSLWGWKPNVSKVQWIDSAGARGYQGVTMHADLDGDGRIDASVTWSNMTRDKLPTPTVHDGLLWFH